MSNNKWTPGPWEWDGGWLVAELGRGPVIGPTYVVDADARLIAAAPDMAEALERIIGWREIDRALLRDRLEEIEDIARAALKKARGE